MKKIVIPATLLIFISCSDDNPSENQAPSINPIPDKITFTNRQVSPFEITVSDPDTEISQVSLTAVSEDQILLPDANIEIEGSGSNRLTIITPADDEIGFTVIEVTADDGQSTSTQSFSLTVNQAPSTWQLQNSGTTNALNSLYIMGDSLGWIVGSQETILKTIDGGDNWQENTPGDLMQDLKDIMFSGICCGWIVGHHNEEGTIGGKVLYSLDLGETWEENISFPYPLNSVFASQSSLTWVAGENGFIAFSSNSGQSWIYTNTSGNENINSIFFIDDDIGWVVGDNASIYTSEDSGENWNALIVNGSFDLNDVFFIDELTGWACGSLNTLIKTTNGGLSWINFKPSIGFPEDNWQGIYFIDKNTGWMIGRNGRIFISVDGGASWNYNGNSEIGTNLRSIVMIDQYTGYIVGEEGTILKYNP
jgi:photosystem II stability/assembly factor-like uncharacterized protein